MATKKKKDFPPVTLSDEGEVLVLHLGTEWIQGAMQKSRPNDIVLEYAQQMMIWMLFYDQPKHIVQLGLGSGALTKFCYHQFPNSKITTVEINPNVVNMCRRFFHLPENDDRLNVIIQDAYEFIVEHAKLNDIDILQVDVYDELAAAPVFDTPAFYKLCSKSLTENGMMTVNIFGEKSDRYKSLEAIYESFESVVWLPEVHNANMVAIAFKKSPEATFEDLFNKAKAINQKTRLLTKRWVEGLYKWMESGVEEETMIK